VIASDETKGALDVVMVALNAITSVTTAAIAYILSDLRNRVTRVEDLHMIKAAGYEGPERRRK